MSGHLSAEEKAAFKAGVLSARKQDYALFIAFLEVNNIPFERTGGTVILESMVVYEDLMVSYGSPKTYQYTLETLKRRVTSFTTLKLKAKFIGTDSLGYRYGWSYILRVVPVDGIVITREDGTGKCVYQSFAALLVNWDNIEKIK
jgi:hypothetical protein